MNVDRHITFVVSLLKVCIVVGHWLGSHAVSLLLSYSEDERATCAGKNSSSCIPFPLMPPCECHRFAASATV